jgi:hypothetical protein
MTGGHSGEWYWNNLERAKEYRRKQYQIKRQWYLEQAKEGYLKAKMKVVTAYGGKCVCCGESIVEFLSVDHIRGDGAKQRRELKMSGGGQFYYWLINHNYPKDFQVLCMNCNHAKGTNGVCPHQKK